MERREALKRTALMGGSALLGPSLISLLQSCQRQPRLDWTPIFLNQEQAQFISALVDTLLPKTETPGALDVKVDMFIDAVAGKVYNEAGQKALVDGIAAFEANCQKKFGNTFANLNADEKKEILKAEEASAGKFNHQVWGTAVGKQEPVGFYRSLKSLALWGYFSSEAIGKGVLTYDPIPGGYLGCIPLDQVGNSWSL